jgi:rhodanese-related sulfurtransferase
MVGRGAIHAPCDDGAMSSTVHGDEVPAVGRDQLIDALRAGRVTLVDVLSPESFAANHIPGATNLALGDITARAGAVLPERHAPVVVYCGGPT